MKTPNAPQPHNDVAPIGIIPLTHPVFVVQDGGSLYLHETAGVDQLVSYLCHGITRNPLDLRMHTRLIFLQLRQKDSTALFTALLDLFLALEDKGLSLRRHLLRLCSSHLQPHQHQLLADGLDEGLRPDTPLADTGLSLLHKGIESDTPLVNNLQARHERLPADPYSEAMAYLEYGQLDQALDLLEAAMIAEPSNTIIRGELLSIYKKGDMKERYEKQTQAMRQAGHSLPSDWCL